MTKGIIALVCVMSCTGVAQGATKSGEYTIVGVGGVSCGSYVKSSEYHASVNSWMGGYITAFSRFSKMTAGVSDASGTSDVASREVWMENWCRAHPLKNIDAGMDELLIEMAGTVTKEK